MQLTRLLHESGRYQVHVACLDDEGVLRSDIDCLALGEIPCYRLNSFYDLNMVKQIRRFAHYVREHKISVVHTHDFYTNVFGIIVIFL